MDSPNIPLNGPPLSPARFGQQMRFALGWVIAEDYRSAKIDPLANAAPRILGHMNSDQVPAMIQLAKVYAGLDATEAAMTVVDLLGSHLRLKTNDGRKGTRINFLRKSKARTKRAKCSWTWFEELSQEPD